jgi:hypothetical protein
MSKEPLDHLWCQDCDAWYLQSACARPTLYSVHSDDHALDSSYNGRAYFTTFREEEVWRCPNGCYIVDPNDGDVTTPQHAKGIFYECQECNGQYDDKDEADECCN